MDNIIIPLPPQFSCMGDSLVIEDTLPWKTYSVGKVDYTLEGENVFHVTLSHTGDAIVLTGSLQACAQGQCARCLESAHFSIDGEVEGLYLINPNADIAQDLEEDEYTVLDNKESIDISSALYATLVFETPLVLLCKEDCKGLCSICGENLNENSCSCKNDAIDPLNPFASLKDFIFTDN